MASQTTRIVASVIDDLASALASQVGCTETADNSVRSSGRVTLHFDPQTKGAGGYDDHPGPQTNVARAWQNRCALIPSEAAELKREFVSMMRNGVSEPVMAKQAKDPADVALADWGLPALPTTPLEQAMFAGSLFGGRFGKWFRRTAERPSHRSDEPTATSPLEKTPTGAKSRELPPGFPTTVEETRSFLHSLGPNGFKEMVRRPAKTQLWDQEVTLTVVEYRGVADSYLYLAFFENKLVSFIMHNGKALSVPDQIKGLQTYLPFTLTHFFPQIFRVP